MVSETERVRFPATLAVRLSHEAAKAVRQQASEQNQRVSEYLREVVLREVSPAQVGDLEH